MVCLKPVTLSVVVLLFTCACAGDLPQVENCAPTDCDGNGAIKSPDVDFKERIKTAFRFCGKFDIEPQQCSACADGIYAQSLQTEDGDRCVTKSHFRSAMRFCLAVINDNGPPLPSGEVPDEVEGLPLPPPNSSVTAIPLTGTSSRLESLKLETNADVPSLLASHSSRYFGDVDCGVKWRTSNGYIIYPVCANMVCATHGPPRWYRDLVEDCCEERSDYLGGTKWKTNCWYYAD